MDGADVLISKQNGKHATTEDLVEFTKRALGESAEKQRAIGSNYSDLPAGYVQTPGDTLDLSSKGARKLPIEVIELIKDRVERLALSHNAQIIVPPEIALCSRLFYLNLRWNSFRAFPEAVLDLTNLQTLDVSRNRITSIPSGIRNMTNLKFLAFTNNLVTRLPLCLGEMPSLTKLKFDDNPVEYPPQEEYFPSASILAKPGLDPNTYICTQVKKFMRQVAIKERHKVDADGEASESNLETPRPPRRTTTGRFPVRPSVSGIDTSEFMGKGDGPFIMPPPPIPQKSRARDSLILPAIRRPGLAPLLTDGLISRSRSETVAGGSMRSKRLGFVPRKTSGPPGFANNISDNRTLKPIHYRGASYSSAIHPSSGGETSSGPVSPIDGSSYRPWTAKSRLSSLPEDKRVSKIQSPTIRSSRLLVFSLYHLNRPIEDIATMLSNENPGMSHIERLHHSAAMNLAELDRQLHILTPVAELDNQESATHVRAILKRSRYCVRAYGHVIFELRQSTSKMATTGDPVYLRSLIVQIFATMVEVRNACGIQEAALKSPPNVKWTRPGSERTITPTQSRPAVSGKRLKGMKILAGLKSKSSPSSVPSSATLMVHHSTRRNMVPGMNGSATPRSGDSFGQQVMPRNSHAHAQAQAVDAEEERQFEKIYLNLQHVCALADQILPNCRLDFFARKEGAIRSMQAGAARAWNLALGKCDSVLSALEQLKTRLAKITLKDPALRTSRDFWYLCDLFVRSWFDLGSEMKNLANQGLDIGTIKVMMRPVQKAVKDVGHFIDHSPVYKGALRAQQTLTAVPPMPSMPPTPLSAALGPAAQATIPSTPSIVSPAEYMYSYNHGKERERERSDTVGSRYSRR